MGLKRSSWAARFAKGTIWAALSFAGTLSAMLSAFCCRVREGRGVVGACGGRGSSAWRAQCSEVSGPCTDPCPFPAMR